MDEKTISAVIQSVVQKMTANGALSALDDMTLAVAKKLIARVEEKAKEIGVNAVVAVANRSGRPVAVECMDDSYIASYDIAVGKSYTSAALKMSTIELKPLAQPGGSLYGIQHTNQGQIVIFGGGVPLHCGNRLVGALGVSGGTEEQDTALAQYGQDVFFKCIEQ